MNYPYELPKLPYAYNALEPHIDAQTMEIHHTKHHQTYVDKLNAAVKDVSDLQSMDLVELMKKLNSMSLAEPVMKAVKNHGGGHLNHSFFWTLMDPSNTKNEDLVKRIENKWGMDAFKEAFNTAATNHFGSGWAWLVEDANKELMIYTTANQDSPYLHGHTPLLGLDVWEHAYYLKYQNKRVDYIKAWWNVVKII